MRSSDVDGHDTQEFDDSPIDYIREYDAFVMDKVQVLNSSNETLSLASKAMLIEVMQYTRDIIIELEHDKLADQDKLEARLGMIAFYLTVVANHTGFDLWWIINKNKEHINKLPSFKLVTAFHAPVHPKVRKFTEKLLRVLHVYV